MRDFDPIQYCQDGMDITSSPYAEQDATEVRAWTETGDLIAAVEMDANGVWRIAEGEHCGERLGDADGSDNRSDALEYIHRSFPNDSYLTTMVNAYIEAGLWSSTDTREDEDSPRPLDDDFDASDLSPQARDSIESDCRDFANANWADLRDMDPSQAGHDFLLTRDHNGAGFWDRGLGDKGDRLTEAAHSYGESGLYIGDDEQIHTTNQDNEDYRACVDCGCER